mgnify:CR=1 FL=1
MLKQESGGWDMTQREAERRRTVNVAAMAVSLAVIGLFYAVTHWNSWFNASIFLRHREKFPLQLVLREILLNSDTTVAGSTLNTDALRAIDQNDFYFKELVQYSTIIVSIVPILCVYPFLQKYFVKGVMIGSLKG